MDHADTQDRDDTDLVGTVEAAEILHVDRSTITRRVQIGRLRPVMRLPGTRGVYLFDRDYIETIATGGAA